MNAADVAERLQKPRRTGAGWTACCPAHDDSNPSLSINDGEKGVVVKCWSGCSQESVLNALEAQGIEIRKHKTNGNGAVYDHTFNVGILAAAKKLPEELLTDSHVLNEGNRVAFVYLDRGEGYCKTKYRGALAGDRKFSWSKDPLDGEIIPYGMWLMDDMLANDGRIVLVEGETDALTLWHHGFAALGVPGATHWNDQWAAMLPASGSIYVVVEPDEGGKKFEESFRKSTLAPRIHFIRMGLDAKDVNALHCQGPEKFQEAFEDLIERAEPAIAPVKQPMQWSKLALSTPPEREWAIDRWLGMGHVTLLAGAGGLGKTSIAQALGSCVALQRDYLDNVPKKRRVLMWACEDDEGELWRRQIAIAQALKEPLESFQNEFVLQSYDGEDVELCCLKDGQVAYSPMLNVLTEQIGDFGASVVILDNIARLYGCNENDRHQVTQFISALTRASRSTGAAIMLLGHPAKGPNSEYSGSTAWEGSVRSRLYLGRNLPDKEPVAEDTEDDGIRYLCRRKANYTTRDYRRIRYANGVMIPDDAERPVSVRPTEYAQDVVVRAVVSLDRMGKYGNASTSSPDYLPKLAENYNLMEGIGRKQFSVAMRELELAGKLKMEAVGQYQNRTPKMGFKAKGV